MMGDETEHSVELLERLLGDPQLRRRFRTDAAAVLNEAGLPELAAGLGHGGRALMTLEMRESRSSLAGVMVAAAAEGVDLAQFAEHAAPALARDAGDAIHQLMQHPHHPAPTPVPEAAPQRPAAPNFSSPAEAPTLAQPEPKAPSAANTALPAGQPAASAAPAAPPQSDGASASAPAAMQTPSQGARLVTSSEGPTAPHAGGGAGHAGAGHAGSGGARSGGAGSGGAGSGGASVAPDPGQHPPGQHASGQQGHQPAGTAAAPVAPEPPDAGPAYPGDQATPQQIAAWMGAHAQRAGLPPELPVMAALTESGLRNLSYGDRDSVGFFQMRVGIWDQGAYAGYPSNPELQIQWFIDHAVAVKSEYPGLVNDPNSWGEWVANVEQPAQQYRYRYQLQLSTAQALLHGADLTSGASAAPATPAPGGASQIPVGQAALKVAMHFTGGGQPGSSLDTGPSSAEMVQFAYSQQGVQLPRVAAQQFDIGMPVSQQHLKPGDAVFFAERDGYVDHVGLYVGNGRFVTSVEGGGGVRLASIADPPFQGQRFIGGRRYTPEALGDPGRFARPLPTIKG